MSNIWTNMPLPAPLLDRLRTSIASNQLLISGQVTGILNSAGSDPALADADIAYGQPDPDQILTVNRLKWIHLSTAGYTRYDRADLRQFVARNKIIVTNSSSVFDEPCAEHILAFMLAAARDLPAASANQLSARGWPQEPIRNRCFLLKGQSTLLIGYGSIARRIVELLQPFSMNLSAVRRTPVGNEGIPVEPLGALDRLLPEADHVISTLPGAQSTERFMNARRFALMKRTAVFYNIGRGTTVDQPALVDALNSGRLGGAYLDVTDPEPLPANHPLWTAKNCFITPHTGGGHFNEFDRNVDHFLANLKRFENYEPMRDKIF